MSSISDPSGACPGSGTARAQEKSCHISRWGHPNHWDEFCSSPGEYVRLDQELSTMVTFWQSSFFHVSFELWVFLLISTGIQPSPSSHIRYKPVVLLRPAALSLNSATHPFLSLQEDMKYSRTSLTPTLVLLKPTRVTSCDAYAPSLL